MPRESKRGIHGDNPDAEYSVRRDGLTVRATAIADARPALHLGVPQANLTPSLTPFVLLDTCVQTPPLPPGAAPPAVPAAVTVQASGNGPSSNGSGTARATRCSGP